MTKYIKINTSTLFTNNIITITTYPITMDNNHILLYEIIIHNNGIQTIYIRIDNSIISLQDITQYNTISFLELQIRLHKYLKNNTKAYNILINNIQKNIKT